MEVSENAHKIKIAYFLLVHNNPKQLNMFLRQILDCGDCDIYIHVDKKNKAMIDSILKDNRITVISEFDVQWASFEMMAATISMMKTAVKSGKRYTHAYYGSGNDLLVRKGLYEYLAENPDKLFMRVHEKVKNNDPSAIRYRIRWPRKLMVRNNYHPYRFIRWLYHILFRCGIVIHENKLQIEFNEIYRASQWFIVPYDVIQYIIDYLTKHPEYVKFWKYSLAPDQFMLQTIILNSEYKNNVTASLMYISVTMSLMSHNHPDTITMKDITAIEYSGCYCARKFDIKTNGDAIKYFLDKTSQGE